MKVVEDTAILSDETTKTRQNIDETIIVIQALEQALAEKVEVCPTFSVC